MLPKPIPSKKNEGSRFVVSEGFADSSTRVSWVISQSWICFFFRLSLFYPIQFHPEPNEDGQVSVGAQFFLERILLASDASCGNDTANNTQRQHDLHILTLHALLRPYCSKIDENKCCWVGIIGTWWWGYKQSGDEAPKTIPRIGGKHAASTILYGFDFMYGIEKSECDWKHFSRNIKLKTIDLFLEPF